MANRSPIVVLAAVITCYLAGPVVAFLVRLAGSSARGFSAPGLFESLAVSVTTATITTASVTVFGVPLAYLLARSRRRAARALGVLVVVPLAVPPVMSGVILVYLVGPYTAIGSFFGGRLTESMAGVVLAQSFVSAPFLVVAARAAFSAVDPTLLDMAATLGLHEIRRFLTVAVPLAGAGIRAGMLLAWLRAFGEYGATSIVAYHPYTLSVFNNLQFSLGLQGTLAPTALALGGAAVVLAASVLPLPPAPRRLRSSRRLPDALLASGSAPLPAAAVAPGGPVVRAAAAGRPVVPAAALELHLDLRLGSFRLSLEAVAPSGRLAVLGPSGSGKSATLRALAGLFGTDAGQVRLGGREVGTLSPEERPIGYVTQGLSLFPHLDVWRQVTFGAGARPEIAARWLSELGLEELAGRMPEQLSGGQRQRVRLVQALARAPELLLLDEPLSALDVPVRAELRQQLRQLQRETSLSTVIVTHDPAEAAVLADDLVVLADGTVLQAGARAEVFAHPASVAVAGLLGWPNLFGGTVAEPGMITCGGIVVRLPTGPLAVGERVSWGVRPEGIEIEAADGTGDGPLVAGVVEDVIDLGPTTELAVSIGAGVMLRLAAQRRRFPPVGSPCAVRLDPEAAMVWPEPGGT